MAAVVLTIVLIVVAWLLYKAIEDARRQKAGGTATSAPASPVPPRVRPKPKVRQRPRRSTPAEIDREGLAEHVHKLRLAIDDDLITMDEGVASVVRFTDGALGDDAARKLLRDAG